MAKARKKGKSRKKSVADDSDAKSACLPILPPEIIRMIFQHLDRDKSTLRACSYAARNFRYIALSLLGRHITVSTVSRLEHLVRLITQGAFQHVRSLDLGVDNRKVVLENHWRHYAVILKSFAQYRSLDRLWLSEVPFIFIKENQKKDLQETIVALGSTVNELGLYGCHFSSYEEMISLIRSFPLCKSLFIRDCITGEQATGANALAGLHGHRLTIKDLQLYASSSNNFLIDVSNLIEDVALDTRSLTALTCDFGTAERAQRVAAATALSPVEQFQVACRQPGCFRAFMDNFSKWTLTHLTIGPQVLATDTEFWAEAFKDLPLFPSVKEVTLIHKYPNSTPFTTDCWRYFDRTLSRRDLFPALRKVSIRLGYSSIEVGYRRWSTVLDSMLQVRRCGIRVYHC